MPLVLHVLYLLWLEPMATGKISDKAIEALITKHYPLTPKSIIESLGLKLPIFKYTVNNGHFGKTDEIFTWEKLSDIDIFKHLV